MATSQNEELWAIQEDARLKGAYAERMRAEATAAALAIAGSRTERAAQPASAGERPYIPAHVDQVPNPLRDPANNPQSM